MERDWVELLRIPLPPPNPHALPTIATTIAFDDVSELLWAGNEYVRQVAERCFSKLADCRRSSRAELRPSMALNSRGIPPFEPILSPMALCDKYYSTRGVSYHFRRRVYI
jgi:hypothetical protein